MCVFSNNEQSKFARIICWIGFIVPSHGLASSRLYASPIFTGNINSRLQVGMVKYCHREKILPYFTVLAAAAHTGIRLAHAYPAFYNMSGAVEFMMHIENSNPYTQPKCVCVCLGHKPIVTSTQWWSTNCILVRNSSRCNNDNLSLWHVLAPTNAIMKDLD